MRPEDLPRITASHMVKSVDLNHHGTLYAGRAAEWVVETGFMTARAALDCSPANIVCVRMNGMDFREPVRAGETIVMEGRPVTVGRTSISIYVKVTTLRPHQPPKLATEGLLTFVHVIEGKAMPHGVTAEPTADPELQRLQAVLEAERARSRQG